MHVQNSLPANSLKEYVSTPDPFCEIRHAVTAAVTSISVEFRSRYFWGDNCSSLSVAAANDSAGDADSSGAALSETQVLHASKNPIKPDLDLTPLQKGDLGIFIHISQPNNVTYLAA